jgi:hypothetical protein
MAKVFVVTEGEYSDYHIVAVFSTRKKAKEFAPAADGGSVRIETYEIDAPPKRGRKLLFVHTVHIGIYTGILSDYSKCSAERPQRWSDISEPFKSWSNVELIRVSSAVSKEHAEKLAIEARQKFLREDGRT